jgi:hypothetical protein
MITRGHPREGPVRVPGICDNSAEVGDGLRRGAEAVVFLPFPDIMKKRSVGVGIWTSRRRTSQGD